MPSIFTNGVVRIRLIVSFLTVTWLGLATLSSALAHFADVLQNRAKSDLANANYFMLDITLQKLMSDTLITMVITALISAMLSIFGILILVHPRWIQEDCKARVYYGCMSFLLSLPVVTIGGCVAGGIHGLQSSFELLDRDGSFPYYVVMYYGAVGQAAFGAAVVILILIHFVAAI
ncbi:hypothetical protein DTO013E5_9736 [Penicillium roqueforti]|uniref:Uncharacterized protein n=1 Tax=Penicillium roqueforti (strain FM164) TaxID=1365484 RepID=W6R999_PENRF|nr:hypothetical protein DTO012A1_9774 [Penicillium roqueforti]CDM38432.1 unnamed protein product [Penicillium roqueforti FM164]KAI2737411.1 hypothetical protein DTO013F2_9785 [Penicillium roqueforti]KAI2767773.1 hypothetical protein DTO012A8_6988 [Penicillium roqueforti]KAI3063068.1 hypothetical protein CBS147339_9738 [Penicillium roqueforti]